MQSKNSVPNCNSIRLTTENEVSLIAASGLATLQRTLGSNGEFVTSSRAEEGRETTTSSPPSAVGGESSEDVERRLQYIMCVA